MAQPWDCPKMRKPHVWNLRNSEGLQYCVMCGCQRKTRKVASGGVDHVEQNTRQDKEERAFEAGMIEATWTLTEGME